ncbi:hypothetical protein MKX03_020958, partial [Papaver bracteatum]
DALNAPEVNENQKGADPSSTSNNVPVSPNSEHKNTRTMQGICLTPNDKTVLVCWKIRLLIQVMDLKVVALTSGLMQRISTQLYIGPSPII